MMMLIIAFLTTNPHQGSPLYTLCASEINCAIHTIIKYSMLFLPLGVSKTMKTKHVVWKKKKRCGWWQWSCVGSWGLLSSLFNKHHWLWKSSWHELGRNVHGRSNVSLVPVTFSHICGHNHGSMMKGTVTLNTMTDFSGFKQFGIQ